MARALNDLPTRRKTELCFQGGPKDGQFIDWYDVPPTFEVQRILPVVAVLTVEDLPPTDPFQRGTYELVPTDEDHLWRVARLYRWKGWHGEPK